jgi:hypothetical protein
VRMLDLASPNWTQSHWPWTGLTSVASANPNAFRVDHYLRFARFRPPRPLPSCSLEPPIFSQLLTRANETKLKLRPRLCIRL